MGRKEYYAHSDPTGRRGRQRLSEYLEETARLPNSSPSLSGRRIGDVNRPALSLQSVRVCRGKNERNWIVAKSTLFRYYFLIQETKKQYRWISCFSLQGTKIRGENCEL
jgi:hypothetical protein